MDIQEVANQLHPLERKILPHLQDHSTQETLATKSNMQPVEVTRALQWLENKGVLTRNKITTIIITLGDNGKKYLQEGLPEQQLLKELEKKPRSIIDVKENSKLTPEEFTIALGTLKKQQAITITNGKLDLTKKGEELLTKKTPEQQLLEQLPTPANNLNTQLLKELKQRKQLIKEEEQTIITIQLTPLGRKLTTIKLNTELLETVTPQLLQQQNWKNKNFRSYDIKAPVPTITGGKRHFTNDTLHYIRNIWKNLGFQEMTGTKVQTSFWNFDALFTPQDHPARELQDTYYIKQPAQGKLPSFWKDIAAVHKNGGTTGSKGWGEHWNPKEAQRNVLRTHTTCLSAQTLRNIKDKNIKLPCKYFSVGKVFRNETLDWKHLFEFYQTEGIVIDEHANLQHLLGYLKTFFTAMGHDKVRFRPGPFPYTEPSVEVDIWHPTRKTWVEFGGAGIFRPEVVEPLLGKFVPVLAWGLGVDRISVENYGIKDLRDMYGNDLEQLRTMKTRIL
ncbi:MAG TPA: phenylalanine--tRNA ligase subunit alpha [Candidatus Nanoarchaeia archaeon]|nr:phenylalanine--tRNA ligase subunit alpha [Candidatus Nanoarchaeia archaeon]